MELSFKDVIDRYGPTAALVAVLVLLVTVLPGNIKDGSSKGDNVVAGAAANGTDGSAGSDTGALTEGSSADGSGGTGGATLGGPGAAGTGGTGSSGATGSGATATAGGRSNAGGPAGTAATGGANGNGGVVAAQQGTFPCRPDGRQAGVSIAMPPCRQYDTSKGNGGATAKGVTPTQVRVAYYVPQASAATTAALKAAGVADDPVDIHRIMEVYRQYWNAHAQTYGREVIFDQASRRAAPRATTCREGRRQADRRAGNYFAVIMAAGTTGSPTFDRSVANTGVDLHRLHHDPVGLVLQGHRGPELRLPARQSASTTRTSPSTSASGSSAATARPSTPAPTHRSTCEPAPQVRPHLAQRQHGHGRPGRPGGAGLLLQHPAAEVRDPEGRRPTPATTTTSRRGRPPPRR